MVALALVVVLAGAILLQAVFPARRLQIVLSGAAASCALATAGGVSTTPKLLSAVPWDVLVLLVALGLLTEVLVASRVFSVTAVALTRATGANPSLFALALASVMFLVSGVVNNLTALLLVLPVMLVVLRQLGVTQRYLTWCMGALLVACNLGGAATPIGDFPAILLLGRGAMRFDDYLERAFPLALAALGLMLALTGLAARPARDVEHTPLGSRLTISTLRALHRGIRVDWRALAPGALALAGMLAAWVLLPVSPDLVAWVGALVALAASGAAGEKLLRTRVDVEATLFLLALFVMVGAVRETGAFGQLASALIELPISPRLQVAVFLVSAAVLTGIFSAGPSMAALLEVAEELAKTHPPGAIYVGLAFSVCAGSSLFLTAATAGPLMQGLIERAGLRGPDGAPLRFGFFDYAPVGLLGFAVTLAVGMVSTLAAIAGRGP